MSDSFYFNEKHLSQNPALEVLQQLGFTYLSPEDALKARDGKPSNVLLEGILETQLKNLNRIKFEGQEYLFSEENIQAAIQKLKNIKYDGLQKTNEAIYDLLTLGESFPQTINGNTKSFTMKYVDWQNPGNNIYHVTSEFSVEKSRSLETIRPDIVLFVNGIPLAVIECKSPQIECEQAISQMIRNQGEDYIPKLFTYTQLLIATNKNSIQYATTGTPMKFWSIWKELEDKEKSISDALTPSDSRTLTEQDKAIYSLCRPERLLDLIYRFIVVDAGIKKIARYQQYFVVKSTINRVKRIATDGKRTGGIVWHTQGSGKSLTMVMLTRALALDTEISNSRILLVTDRDDLDKQLGNTFAACGLSTERAESGRNLVKHLKNKVGIITTLIHKFDKGWLSEKFSDPSHDIFVLVDESHRTHFGSLAARMRQMLPNACYLGFTGTPLMKKEKNNFAKFGGIIEPHYSINQAVTDKSVLPLLYEGRHVEMVQNKAAIDLWFERHTDGLTDLQKADLKRKYARAEMLSKTDQVIYMRAFDISEHFRANWQGTGFKAQLVAPDKASALKYQHYLNDIGIVTSEVVISGPDSRDDYEVVGEDPNNDVAKFWNRMMNRFGSEEEYTKQLINQFKYGETPEILIVVSKLLTGFDAPKNTVLYLCKLLKEHTLLQAIARVNRLHEGKDFGYIVDYVSVLGELDKALTMYDAFEGFDEDDLIGTLYSIQVEVQRLPQVYSDLWDIFREVKNKRDEEAFEQLLANEELREDFYDRLSEYSKLLGIALSSDKFVMETNDEKLRKYKDDLNRFQGLRASVKLRYADAIDYKSYHPKIKKLLDTHVQANNVIQINEPVNIFNEETFTKVKEGQGIYSEKPTAAKADIIAHATKKVITEKMDEDPAFYERFSKLIQQAIDDFKAKRISDLDYLNKATQIRNDVVSKHRDDVPSTIKNNDEACAYFGVIQPFISNATHTIDLDELIAATALKIQDTLVKHWIVDFWNNDRAKNAAINDVDDFLFDELKNRYGIELSLEQMDEIIEKTMFIAKARRPS